MICINAADDFDTDVSWKWNVPWHVAISMFQNCEMRKSFVTLGYSTFLRGPVDFHSTCLLVHLLALFYHIAAVPGTKILVTSGVLLLQTVVPLFRDNAAISILSSFVPPYVPRRTVDLARGKKA